MKKFRMAVVGTGMMAQMRTKALLDTGCIELVGVASKSEVNATTFGAKWLCSFTTTDYQQLTQCEPDMLLIELPHDVQSEVVNWALDNQFHLLIGSCIAMNSFELNRIKERSFQFNLLVEGGFEARYKAVWKKAKSIIQQGEIGEVCAVQSISCWAANTNSWYYSQEKSGGMPLTHMTYAFLNPLTWVLGMPKHVSAFSNTTGAIHAESVTELTCSVNIEYEKKVVCNVLSSYIHHPSAPSWKVFILGTTGSMEVFPSEFGGGSIIQYNANKAPLHLQFDDAEDPFLLQAKAFVEALSGNENTLQNSVSEGEKDVILAETIVESIHRKETLTLPNV